MAVTDYPTAEWVARQLLEAFPRDSAPRYLLRDRDGSYGEDFRETANWLGIQEVLTAPQSPWQNAYVERLIGSRGQVRLSRFPRSAACIIATNVSPPERAQSPAYCSPELLLLVSWKTVNEGVRTKSC